MNSFAIKMLACAIMVIDHLGAIFFHGDPLLRGIGRLAFPLFAYLVASGYRHTKDPTSYLGRLFLFSLISQPFYTYAFHYDTVHFNIFFTLTAGLYGIYAYEKKKSLLPVLLAGISSEFVRASYGLPGVMMIFVMFYYIENPWKMGLAVLAAAVLGSVRGIVWRAFTDPSFVLTASYLSHHCITLLLEPLAALSVPLTTLYNGRQGPKIKYFFYFFYPGHLAILGLIRAFVKH